jgi:ADP-ribose pyrophosphatase
MNTESNSKKSSGLPIKVPAFEGSPKTFKGIRFDVHTVQLHGKKGTPLKRDVVVHPGAVLILPLLDKENIVMIRNQRFAVGQELWELPAGTLEPGEPPIETAKRELIEETGYRTENIAPLLHFYTSPGITNEVMYAFTANKLHFVGQALEESEQIRVEVVSWKKALQMAYEGTIVDGKTLIALLFYHQFISEKSL